MRVFLNEILITFAEIIQAEIVTISLESVRMVLHDSVIFPSALRADIETALIRKGMLSAYRTKMRVWCVVRLQIIIIWIFSNLFPVLFFVLLQRHAILDIHQVRVFDLFQVVFPTTLCTLLGKAVFDVILCKFRKIKGMAYGAFHWFKQFFSAFFCCFANCSPHKKMLSFKYKKKG